MRRGKAAVHWSVCCTPPTVAAAIRRYGDSIEFTGLSVEQESTIGSRYM
jgi:hypothetical protein